MKTTTQNQTDLTNRRIGFSFEEIKAFEYKATGGNIHPKSTHSPEGENEIQIRVPDSIYVKIMYFRKRGNKFYYNGSETYYPNHN